MYAYFMGRQDEPIDDDLAESEPEQYSARMSAEETAELWQLSDYDPEVMNGYSKEELLACLHEKKKQCG